MNLCSCLNRYLTQIFLTGIFLLGLGLVVGLPAIAYILLYKDQRKGPSQQTSGDAEGDLAPTLSTRLMGKLSESETRRLVKSATKLRNKLQALSVEQDAQDSLPGTSSQYPVENNRFRSFSEFVSIFSVRTKWQPLKRTR